MYFLTMDVLGGVLPARGTRYLIAGLDPNACTGGWCVGEGFLRVRRERGWVRYHTFVPGCGGDVWVCRNEHDGKFATYGFWELGLPGQPKE